MREIRPGRGRWEGARLRLALGLGALDDAGALRAAATSAATGQVAAPSPATCPRSGVGGSEARRPPPGAARTCVTGAGLTPPPAGKGAGGGRREPARRARAGRGRGPTLTLPLLGLPEKAVWGRGENVVRPRQVPTPSRPRPLPAFP